MLLLIYNIVTMELATLIANVRLAINVFPACLPWKIFSMCSEIKSGWSPGYEAVMEPISEETTISLYN